MLVSLTEQGKVCVRARKPTGNRLKDEGQERQEAKTQDCQDDQRLEAFFTGNGTVSRTVLAKG
ncbi:hypothetical protein C3397_15700 [Enterobacter cloacae complex sp. ECNIH16]|nr:hypothetical protein EI562_13850 [Enterobacter asburiae]NEV84877.1 hypothetical protein [Enterobacter asburiae]NQF28256.1 hypothetical protein [Enterobacter asburiae]POV38629.1 hypothetical protein C3394_17850 [Enterobacter cloacae complex sp. ECNIH11]POV42929.1 hypothetical protein C3397_15700 [Enterobacter cloacae complex sp. ECNIH16]